MKVLPKLGYINENNFKIWKSKELITCWAVVNTPIGISLLCFYLVKLSLETWLAGAQFFKGQQTNMKSKSPQLSGICCA